jgi:hypothetical protein
MELRDAPGEFLQPCEHRLGDGGHGRKPPYSAPLLQEESHAGLQSVESGLTRAESSPAKHVSQNTKLQGYPTFSWIQLHGPRPHGVKLDPTIRRSAQTHFSPPAAMHAFRETTALVDATPRPLRLVAERMTSGTGEVVLSRWEKQARHPTVALLSGPGPVSRAEKPGSPAAVMQLGGDDRDPLEADQVILPVSGGVDRPDQEEPSHGAGRFRFVLGSPGHDEEALWSGYSPEKMPGHPEARACLQTSQADDLPDVDHERVLNEGLLPDR